MNITYTPWGKPDRVRIVAEGITEVSTPSHGGFHLSAERVAQMPEDARKASGWYEEDCEAMWVIRRFFDEVKHVLCGDPEKVRETVAAIIDRHYKGDFSRVRMST